MEEKVIIRGIPYTGKVITIILVIFGILLSFYSIMESFTYLCDSYENHEHRYWCYEESYDGREYLDCEYSRYGSATEYALGREGETYIGAVIACVGGPLLFGLILHLLMKTFGMVVTDKRIYGWSIFQLWRTDLALDAVTSVALVGFTGISVRTAGGNILLFLIKNRKAVHSGICNLLMQRNTSVAVAVKQENVPADVSAAEEEVFAGQTAVSDDMSALRSLKEMLDMGLITQEDYDTKKKQILDL